MEPERHAPTLLPRSCAPIAAALALVVIGCSDEGASGTAAASSSTTTTTCEDRDEDGYVGSAEACADTEGLPGDCDDDDAEVHPRAAEICDDGRDGDCDGRPDADEPVCHPPLFSFVVLTDPHISGGSEDRKARLAKCVAWIDEHRAEHAIELALVLGDVGWGEGQLAAAKQILDELDVPYVPLLGDNEIQFASEEDFAVVFGPHFEQLAAVLDGFQRQPAEAANPSTGGTSWFQNGSFDHRGVHFVTLDWATRKIGEGIGEQADLHDFDGGTWPWFVSDIESAPKTVRESIVMASHHPMHPIFLGAFDDLEQARVAELLDPVGEYVYGDFAGHYHSNGWLAIEPGGYEVFITDDVFEDDLTVRVVGVHPDGAAAFDYRHHVVAVPP